MNLTWKTSQSANALHAVHALARGLQLVPPGLAEALAPLVSEPPPAARGDLRELTANLLQYAAAGFEPDHELAEQTLAQQWGRDSVSASEISPLAAWIGKAQQAYLEWHRSQTDRQLADEIATRTVPLRDHWDARGPGMMRQIGRLTEPWIVAERAEIVTVLPVVGGDGMAHLPVNIVTVEALLANVEPQLPEVVRLGWLASQLEFDLPAIAEQLSPGGAGQMAELAMLPATLAAAESVELAECSPESLCRALSVWRVASTAEEAEALAEVLARWWETYQTSDITWPAAVAALETLLAA